MPNSRHFRTVKLGSAALGAIALLVGASAAGPARGEMHTISAPESRMEAREFLLKAVNPSDSNAVSDALGKAQRLADDMRLWAQDDDIDVQAIKNFQAGQRIKGNAWGESDADELARDDMELSYLKLPIQSVADPRTSGRYKLERAMHWRFAMDDLQKQGKQVDTAYLAKAERQKEDDTALYTQLVDQVEKLTMLRKAALTEPGQQQAAEEGARRH